MPCSYVKPSYINSFVQSQCLSVVSVVTTVRIFELNNVSNSTTLPAQKPLNSAPVSVSQVEQSLCCAKYESWSSFSPGVFVLSGLLKFIL